MFHTLSLSLHAGKAVDFSQCLTVAALCATGQPTLGDHFTVHMFHILALFVLAGKRVDFRLVLDGSGAVCDWPANFFYKQLMETYPDAKVGHCVCKGCIGLTSLHSAVCL
jgi:hypothetical protein